MILREVEELQVLMDKLGEYVEKEQEVSVTLNHMTIAHLHDVLLLSKTVLNKIQDSVKIKKDDMNSIVDSYKESMEEMEYVVNDLVKIFENNEEKVLTK